MRERVAGAHGEEGERSGWVQVGAEVGGRVEVRERMLKRLVIAAACRAGGYVVR